jgi:hypothetical protein
MGRSRVSCAETEWITNAHCGLRRSTRRECTSLCLALYSVTDFQLYYSPTGPRKSPMAELEEAQGGRLWRTWLYRVGNSKTEDGGLEQERYSGWPYRFAGLQQERTPRDGRSEWSKLLHSSQWLLSLTSLK